MEKKKNKIKKKDPILEIKNKRETSICQLQGDDKTTYLFVRSFSNIENFTPEWEYSVSVSTNNT